MPLDASSTLAASTMKLVRRICRVACRAVFVSCTVRTLRLESPRAPCICTPTRSVGFLRARLFFFLVEFDSRRLHKIK